MNGSGAPGTDLELVLIGGGEHARVVLDAARRQGTWSATGFVDPQPNPMLNALGLSWLGDDLAAMKALRGTRCILAVGGVAGTVRRQQVARKYDGLGVIWTSVVHPDSVVSESAEIREGVVVLAGAIINPGVRIAEHCIVNTGAILEHDVHLEPFAHVGPGAVVGGGATIGRGAYIGLGGRVRDHIRIGDAAVVGMGAVVTSEVAGGLVVVGVPARPIVGAPND
jgi:acetyltransferase EpsM